MGLPIVGNALTLMMEETPVLALERMADIYGPIYQLWLNGKRTIVVSSAAILEELIDEKRFRKIAPAALAQKTGEAKGLFSASNDDPDWGQAHRILIQPMGPLPVEGMFDDMKDIANQLILKWARKGPEDRILLTDDFTRLTLDTIALSTMKYRFNSFYSAEMHPYVDAMLNVLEESGARATRPAFISALKYSGRAKFAESEEILKKTAQQIIDNRRANPTGEHDLLNAMIYGKDPKTGQTTSGLLSFTFLYLLKNKDAYAKARKEIDDVLGKRQIAPSDIKHLSYLNACLREALRLSPTATAISKQINPLSQQPFALLDGKYKIDPADRVLVLLGKTQRDPAVYGDDAAEFKPERMLDENFDKLASGAWKPFGNGMRGCIGRPFAWQEALMVAAMVLQHFDLELDDPSYQLKIKQTLTIKPKDLYVRAKARDGLAATVLDQRLHSSIPNGKAHPKINGNGTTPSADDKAPMTILYGSNTGTCLALAQRLSSHASARGFAATVLDMDSAVEKMPQAQPVIVITSSYEGQPPDCAAGFVDWLQHVKGTQLKEVRFAVFGCGHKDWAKTFHAIPKLTNKLMAEAGADRIAPIGFSDVSAGSVYADFEDWEDEVLWPQLTSDIDVDHHDIAISADISTNSRASSLRYDVSVATIISNTILTADGEPTKRHMEVQLPSLSEYECGDYLAVLPLNSEKSVQRIMTHFKLPFDAVITFKGGAETGSSAIPNNTPLSIYDVLRSYVELSQPCTKGALKICAQYTINAEDTIYLQEMSLDAKLFKTEIISKRISFFDILTHIPSIDLPLPVFLGLLPPLHVRQYSISSSPLTNPEMCTITYATILQPSLSDPDTIFEGVASTYLSSLQEGDRIQVSLRKTSKKTFRVPKNMAETPMLMFAAGTGVAPFRGFLQERAVFQSLHSELKLAKAVLFIGCRSQTKDRLFASEIDAWIRDGIVDVRYAFSREPRNSEDCKYVPDRMKRDRELLREMWKRGAKVYVCGSRDFDISVGEAARAITVEKRIEDGLGVKGTVEKEVEDWFAGVACERIANDVFD
ncbi:hypothetical protein EG327_009087 [Venturia inaequalis]|uniref:Bifunctional cytochrome P450/NADPH--P450 reductase n=1 Tax=Venturia inaequalis TaxID=5025 RepID=A0A8H3UNA1_VENIN|nr:hypothetical protein EG327_009087 [Venturia inaequalis]